MGFALFGPQDAFRGADVFPLRISRDALFLAMLRILPDATGRGVGKALVHAVLKEAKARGKRAVECYGDRGWQHEACIVPASFLESIGFRVKREHPRFPLYRIDLGSLAKASLHLTPRLLAVELKKLTRPDVRVLVTHVKPEDRAEVLRELEALGDPRLHVLTQGETIEV